MSGALSSKEPSRSNIGILGIHAPPFKRPLGYTSVCKGFRVRLTEKNAICDTVQMKTLYLGDQPLTVDDVIAIAHQNVVVAVSENRRQAIISIRNQVARFLVDEAPNVYGVNTGFGALAEVRIPRPTASLQTNLLRSHATGVVSRTQCRASDYGDRANVLLLGTSDVRIGFLSLISMLNRDTSSYPRKRIGRASGDLAPLAHLALVLIGEGRAEYQQQTTVASRRLRLLD